MRCAIVCGLTLFLLPAAALAADLKPFDAKLGLWEATTTMEMTGGPAMPKMPQIPPETLAKMPPEQRARMEAMMKSGVGAPRTHTGKSCMTKEMLDRGAFGRNERTANCTHTVVSSSSSRQDVHIECNNEGMTTTGDMTVERIDSGHVKGTMLMKAGGQTPMNIKMNFESKWISADCGDVKPVTPK